MKYQPLAVTTASMTASEMKRERADAIGVMKAPFIRQARLRARRKQELQMIASLPRSAPRTASKNTRVARSKKPMSCFTRSIHGPGLGRSRSQPGWAESKKYGDDIPAAMARNMSKIVQPDWVKANPRAGPRNGA